MNRKLKEEKQNNNSKELFHNLSYLNGQIKVREIENKISNKNYNYFIKKYNIDKKYNNNISSIFIKKMKNNSIPDIIEINGSNDCIKNITENNSISYFRINNATNKNDIKKNNINDSNNMSNFILLKKNSRKSLTEINILNKEKNEKETISKDNCIINNVNEYNGFKPKFMNDIKKEKKINGMQTCSDYKIKFNNYINPPFPNFFSLCRDPSKLIKKCFICDTINKNLYHADKCTHLFCRKCGQLYFEQQINNCIFNLKCPKYSCFQHINIKVLKKILSKYIYEKMIDNMETNSKIYDKNLINNSQNINSSREKIVKKNSIFSKENSSFIENRSLIYNLTYQKEYIFKEDKIPYKKNSNKNLLLKKITNKFYRNSDKDLVNEHVIKIGGSSKFNKAVRKINELKNIFCSRCYKSSLFHVKYKPFIKCLNCGFAICKFCYKKYDNLHFMRNNPYSCRVYFRKNIIYRNNKFVYISQLIYFFGGIIILFIGFTKIEARYLSNYNRNKIYWLYLLIFLVFLFFNLIILIICLPYYPLFLLIVEL